MQTIAAIMGLLACLGAFDVAFAHGGHFHGPEFPAEKGNLATSIKKSSTIIALPRARQAYGVSPRMTGDVEVTHYLSGNCTDKPNTALQLNVRLTTGVSAANPRFPLAPVANASFVGAVFTVPCGAIRSPRANLYALSNTDVPKNNYIWIHMAISDADGKIRGYGSNDGKPKSDVTMKSVVLFEMDPSLDLLDSFPNSTSSLTTYLDRHAVFCVPLLKTERGWQTNLKGKGRNCSDN